MQTVQAYGKESSESHWHILMLRPPVPLNMPANSQSAPGFLDWCCAVGVERALIELRRSLATYEECSPWLSERSILLAWQDLRDALAPYGFAPPPLIVPDYFPTWEEQCATDGDISPFFPRMENTQRNVLDFCRANVELVEKSLAPLRCIDLVAHRFVAYNSSPSLAWDYPGRKLRALRLPLWQVPNTLIRNVLERGATGKEPYYEVVLPPGEHRMRFRPVTVQERGAHRFVPYQFHLPYLAFGAGMFYSEVLSRELMDELRLVKEIIDNKRPIEEIGWPVESPEPALVAITPEDRGIWEEYDRIRYIWNNGELKADQLVPDFLGKIHLKGKGNELPVTTIYGEKSLLLWDWARYRKKYEASLLSDKSICPKCGRYSHRKKGEHRERLCEQCANPGLLSQRKHLKRKKVRDK